MTARPNSMRSGGELRKLSRRLSTVGVDIDTDRLRQIADGAPATEREWVDLNFAMVASTLLTEQRRTKRGRARRRLVQWGIVAGAVVVALNVLLCLGLLFFVMTQKVSPY